MAASTIHEIDYAVADKFGELRADLFDQGITTGEMDLLNASVALVQNLTMVTHNIRDFTDVPGLTLEDWAVA